MVRFNSLSFLVSLLVFTVLFTPTAFAESALAAPVVPAAVIAPASGAESAATALMAEASAEAVSSSITGLSFADGEGEGNAPSTPVAEAIEGGTEKVRVSTGDAAGMHFGLNYFLAARQRILQMESRITSGLAPLPSSGQRDALSGFVGPLEMVSTPVLASVPDRYIISPGDELTVTFWGTMLDIQKLTLLVDREGYVMVPKAGKVVARGMSLESFQKNLQALLRQLMVKDLELIVSLDRLRSIQISVAGEAFRPGSYAISSVTTLFNALYACGGPTERGSLRNLKLLRGQNVVLVDFYDFLLRGDSSKDLNLEAGDTLFIPPAERFASIVGEVYQPGIYELKSSESLQDLTVLARGLKPTAVMQNVKIASIEPHVEKKLVDVDLSTEEGRKHHLYDGDRVMVPAVLPDTMNLVTLQGSVERPGEYQLKPGMRISDLFTETNRLLGDVYLERADLVRLNPDMRTTKIIPLNLGKALSGDLDHNWVLADWDRLIVYSKWDVSFIPERSVQVSGTVQRPESYVRSDGMHIQDLLVRAGGLLPHAYLKRADLLRYDFTTEMTTRIPLDLEKALAGDPTHNLLLMDRDHLRIYGQKEVAYESEHLVHIYGAVQRSGKYLRSEGMTLNDLLFVAGGVLPGARDLVEIAHVNEDGVIYSTVAKLVNGIAEKDEELHDEDVIMIKRSAEYLERPLYVKMEGEIAYNGNYALLSRDERLSSVLKRAGGVTDLAYLKGAVLLRKQENLPSGEQRQDLQRINALFDKLNPLDYQRQLSRNQYLLAQEKNEDLETLATKGGSTVVSSGDAAEAAAIGLAPQVAGSVGETINMGLGAFDRSSSVVTPARQLEGKDLELSNRIIIDLAEVLRHPGRDRDIILQDGDVLYVPRQPTTVSVLGAVVRPTTLQLGRSLDVEEAVRLAGGFADDANLERTLILRVDGSLVPAVKEGWLWGTAYEKVEVGDVVYVPPKVVSLQLEERIDKILATVKYAFTTAASVAAFIVLVGLF